jgi:hypothetical protein
MSDRVQEVEIANTIIDQIPNWLKLAVGYRNPVATETGLRFECRAGCQLIVDIDLDRGADLYNFTVTTKRAAGNGKVRYHAEGIYVDTMVELIDQLDRGVLLNRKVGQ